MVSPKNGTVYVRRGWGDIGRFGAISGDFGKGPMASKTKLELAVEKHVSNFNDAQKELVMTQLSTYRRNMARLAQIESELVALDSMPAVNREEVRYKQAQRMTISHEHSQLATANSKIAAELFEFMKE